MEALFTSLRDLLSCVTQVVVSVITRGEPNGITWCLGTTDGEFGKKKSTLGKGGVFSAVKCY